MGKVRGALGLCSNAEARHFSKLLTENHEKMWRQRDNMAIAVFHQQFARFMVGKFQVSKYAPGDTDVEMSNLYSWFCEDAKEGDEGGVNDIQGKGRRGDLFDNSSEHSRAKRSPFWSDALSSYTARTAAMYIHFQKLSRGFSSEYSKSL